MAGHRVTVGEPADAGVSGRLLPRGGRARYQRGSGEE